MRILVFLTDAFGGIGGIGLYNRDFLTALCSHPECTEVVALPRIMQREPELMPLKLSYRTAALGGKWNYSVTILKLLLADRNFDLIVCGHINLLPLAYLAKKIIGAPLILEIYGIEAWQPTHSSMTNSLVKKIDAFVSISDLTKTRFLKWSHVDERKGHLLPNAIHLEDYGVGPKSPELLRRYGLGGKKVLMTLGRLVSYERCKGFDEILDVLPDLAEKIPEIAYLIVGDGNDRPRLEEKACILGIRERVVFAGYIDESEKTDHYRLSDLYVMPSRGEGFGFVFLEALASGVPCVGSKLDGSREALRNGLLGLLVDPTDADGIKAAILTSLEGSSRNVPEELGYFSFANFVERLRIIVSEIKGI